jgi:purine catabolism regulator
VAEQITIADLVDDPSLSTEVLAGRAGLGTVVRWAQTSEAPDPWTWLGEGELLMTLGLNLPDDAAAQAGFIRRARDAGIVGMIVGDDGYAPEIGQAMLATADLLGFPLLRTGHETPFVVISRTVAAATSTAQGRGVLILSRLYQKASERSRDPRSTQWLTDLTGAHVRVLERVTGLPVLGDREEPTSSTARRHALDTVPATDLHMDGDLDPLVLIHVKQVLTADTQALLREAADAVRHGQEQIRAALDPARGASAPRSREPSVGQRPYVVLAVPDGGARLALSLALAGYPAWVGDAQGVVVVVAAADDLDAVKPLVVSASADVGVSRSRQDVGDLGSAVAEAVDALVPGQGMMEYIPEAVSMLARSATEAHEMVQQVLGPLAQSRNDSLRQTLFTVLETDLSMQRAADRLGIHRQTLVYRLRKVEAMTGHSVHRVPDLARLWLAHEAWAFQRRSISAARPSG